MIDIAMIMTVLDHVCTCHQSVIISPSMPCDIVALISSSKLQRRAPKELAGWRQAKYSNDRRFEAGITIATVEMRHVRWSFRLISKPVVADLSVEHALKMIIVATFLRWHGRSLDLLQAGLYLGPPT
jgi:hypothetical protein